MNELPKLLAEAVSDDPLIAHVDLGGGDAIAVTTSTTYLYRADGLLSDETVETFDHDVDAIAVDAGRRKASIRLATINGERSMKIPVSVTEDVLEALIEGVLRTAEAIDDDETVKAVFRFSELTLVVTDRRLLKHVGNEVWDEEFEVFPYAELSGLDFEEGSVATQIVVETASRRQRVKVPNEESGRVRQAIQTAVFEFHGVSSLAGLRAAVESDDDETDEIDSDGDTDAPGFVSATRSPPADQDVAGPRGRYGSTTADDGEAGGTGDGATNAPGGSGPDDADDIAEELAAVSERLDRQSELLERQQATLEQLVEELRRGR